MIDPQREIRPQPGGFANSDTYLDQPWALTAELFSQSAWLN